MFEYWFHGVKDRDGPFTHHGITHDFLEVVSQIAIYYGEQTTGKFVQALVAHYKKELAFLRVTEWKFEFLVEGHNELSEDRKIILHKLR